MEPKWGPKPEKSGWANWWHVATFGPYDLYTLNNSGDYVEDWLVRYGEDENREWCFVGGDIIQWNRLPDDEYKAAVLAAVALRAGQ